MRWTIALDSPILVAKPWDRILTPDTHAASVVLRLGPDREGRKADPAVQAGSAGLRIAVLAQGRAGAIRPDYPEWYFRDHLVAFINPGHDHATRCMYSVDDRGQAAGEAAWIAPGEEPGDRPSRTLPEPPAAQADFRQLGDGRFWAMLTLPPSEAIWPLGLKIKVGFHEEVIPRPLVWPEQPAWAEDTPLSFGDLFAEAPPVALKSIEFHEPAWGGDPSRGVLRLAPGPTGPREGRVDIVTILPGDSEQSQPSIEWKASPSGDTEIPLPVVFPHRGKWASDARLTARLRLTVRGPDGTALWTGEYPFGFDCGIIVRERYGRRGQALPERPTPAAADFLDRQRAYILARLPNYRRRTTREGAPSDFFLEDVDGGEHVDLAAPDALARVAALLGLRFPDWQDALCAAAMWAYHPCITRHSSAWSRVAGGAEIATVPRLGGCFCADVARLVAGLAEAVGAALSVPLEGYTLGLRGHVVTVVGTPIGRVVLDGMMGHWYPALDHSRLATLDEMRANEEIVRRLWHCPRAHGHEFYFGVQDQILQRWKDGALHFPEAWTVGSGQ